jgi:hypothetical protein
VQKIGERRAAYWQNLGRLRHAEAESFDEFGSYKVAFTPLLASMNGSLLSRANTTGYSVGGACDAIMQLPVARLKWDQIRTPSAEVVILRE